MKKNTLPATLCLLPLLTACSPPPKPTPEPTPRPHAVAFTQPSAVQPSVTQNFDYYLLNLSWSPEFCHSHPGATECAEHSTFVLHGLWPQNNDGTYPHDCSSEPGPRNPADYNDLYPDPGLLRHEWQTHGTCSGLSPDAFFTLARSAFHSVVIPPRLSQLDHQISVPPILILDLFTEANPSLPRASLALSCGNNYLTAIEICLDKRAQAVACGPIRSCRASTVRIAPP